MKRCYGLYLILWSFFVQAAVFHKVLPEDAEAISSAARAYLVSILPEGTDIQMRPLSPSLFVPICHRYQAFMYHIPRESNYATVEVRCMDPQRWSIYVSATLSRFKKTIVATHALSEGQIITDKDIVMQSILMTGGLRYMDQSSALIGLRTNRPIEAGHAFVREDVRLPLVISANHVVEVTVLGRGFQVKSRGMALNDAFPGQSVRVKMPNQQVVQGVATHQGTVNLSL